MNDITYDLVAEIVKASVGDKMDRRPPPSRALYAAAMQYIDRRLSSANLDGDQIARAVGCSRATLYRAFAEQGQTIGDVVRRARLDRVGHLLATMPHLTVSDAAMRYGLLEIRTFNRLFKQFYGMTPSEYRRSSRSDNIARK